MQVVSRKLRIGILPATVPRVTDEHTLCRESAPIPWEELPAAVSQRNGAHFRTYAPPSLRGYVRIPMRADVVEAGSCKERIPATTRPQQYFWRLPSQPDLTPAKNFDKAHNRRPALRQ